MSTSSDLRTLVMHGLRLKGVAEPAAIAEAVDILEADAKPVLDQLVTDGMATYRTGRLSGFSLTRTGREAHAQLLSDELDTTGTRASVQGAYARFRGLNTDLLTICTAWQLRDIDDQPVVNDHVDGDYDAAVIGRLADLHARVAPICEDLGATLDRFAGYRPRLSRAVHKVQGGDRDWFTKPIIPSYHTVWFELHEDLLSTLGIERGSEETS